MGPILLSAVCFFFIFASGYWLSRSGAPYYPVVLTMHKLLALGAVIYLGVTILRRPMVSWTIAVGVLLVVCIAALFATGGMLSARREWPALVRIAHKVAPWLALVSTAVVLVVRGY